MLSEPLGLKDIFCRGVGLAAVVSVDVGFLVLEDITPGLTFPFGNDDSGITPTSP